MSARSLSSTLAGILGCGAAVAAQEPAALDKSTLFDDKPVPLREELLTQSAPATISGSLSSSIISRYVASGFIIGSGPVNQSQLSVSTAKGISAFAWSNYDFGDASLKEVDLGISYGRPIGKIAGGEVSARVGYEHWMYPSGELGKADHIAKAGVSYSGPVNVDLSASYLSDIGEPHAGWRFSANVAKPIPLTSKDAKYRVELTPSVGTDYLVDFFGREGFSHVTPSLSLSVEKGNLKATGFVRQQIGLGESKDITFGGLELKYSFSK